MGARGAIWAHIQISRHFGQNLDLNRNHLAQAVVGMGSATVALETMVCCLMAGDNNWHHLQ